MRHAPILEHSCIQPFANQTQNHSVAYPAVQHFAQLLVIDRIEILAYVFSGAILVIQFATI